MRDLQRLKADSPTDALRLMVRRGEPLADIVRWAVVEQGMEVNAYHYRMPNEHHTTVSHIPRAFLLCDLELYDGVPKSLACDTDKLFIVIAGVTVLDRRSHADV